MVVVAAVSIGGFHLLEHVVQVLQRHAFAIPNGNGLAGSIADIEPVHFIYNTAYLVLVIATVMNLDRRSLDRNPLAKSLLFGVIVLQGWHVFEHAVKMFQFIQLGGQNGVGGVFGIGPGALLPLAPIPLLHLAYNLLVYLPFVLAVVLLKREARWRGSRPLSKYAG